MNKDLNGGLGSMLTTRDERLLFQNRSFKSRVSEFLTGCNRPSLCEKSVHFRL